MAAKKNFLTIAYDDGGGAPKPTKPAQQTTPAQPATQQTTTTNTGAHIPSGATTANTGGTSSAVPASSSSTGGKGLTGVTPNTAAMLAQYEAGWTPSDNVNNAMAYLESVNSGRPAPYTSQYDAQIQEAYNQIMNRDPFRYDLRTDTLYQQYKDQYMTNGRQAMMDTMGQAAGLTGGYGSTYSQNAGQQAYDAYLAQLNNLVPELYDRAFNRYQYEGQEMLNRLNLATGMDDRDYGRYRDTYNDWLTERNYAYDMYGTERQFDYGQWSDMLSYWANRAQQEQAQSNWQKEYELSQKSGRSSGGGGRRSSGSGYDNYEDARLQLAYIWRAETTAEGMNAKLNQIFSQFNLSSSDKAALREYADDLRKDFAANAALSGSASQYYNR